MFFQTSTCVRAMLVSLASVAACTPGSTATPAAGSETPVTTVAPLPPMSPTSQAPISPAPSVAPSQERRVSLVDGGPSVVVPGSNLSVKITSASHKVNAPVAGVSVMFERAGAALAKAEVSWQIESGKIDDRWRELAGRRWDNPSHQYLDERIDGWVVKLVSIDAESTGGSPGAITILVKPAAAGDTP